ncbi:MAG: hypothetical protein K2O58_09535, partial [Bacteroidales bacterium]|nr:hypothetical protein [Bacteroidales bacterium]
IVSGVGEKELVVSTLVVMYSGSDSDFASSDMAPSDRIAVSSDMASDVVAADISASAEGVENMANTSLQRALVKSVTPAGALAYMVFILLYFPCIATFAAIRNEAGGWKWAILTAVYTILLAWVAAFITFRMAMFCGL